MTEQEIVSYLKENKDKGIASGFLPEDVRAWAFIAPISIFRFFDGKEWIKSEKPFIRYNDIICLPDNYEAKKEQKGEWVDFDINKNGDFEISGIENDKNITIIYNWTQWDKPIRDNASKNFINGCCAFGGWQYPDSSYWSTYPQVKQGQGNNYSSYYCEKEQGEDYQTNPAIPVKIRFWREIK